jgi:hypothetical protein
VEQIGIDLVKSQFINMNHCRLSSSDPIFASEYSRSSPEAAFSALAHIRLQYTLAENRLRMSLDVLLVDWFVAETGALTPHLSIVAAGVSSHSRGRHAKSSYIPHPTIKARASKAGWWSYSTIVNMWQRETTVAIV